MPNPFVVADRMRDEMLARERLTFAEVGRWHSEATARVIERVDSLMVDAEVARVAGERVGVLWLQSDRRLSGLLALVDDEMGRFALQVQRRLVDEQRLVLTQAERDARELILVAIGDASAGEIIIPAGLPTDAAERLVGVLPNGDSVSVLVADYGETAQVGVKQAMLVGLEGALRPGQVRTMVQTALGALLTRAESTLRTETLECYRGATTLVYEANSHE